ncbi:metal ABC transporter solute-binding protein, Zn/Mn family [Calothrix sp. PCC 6303]|uniref:metal ABC transporter solute-binding protein, Zn/Mn family n=1 Tax=Calothrix sp. PCC 6303 TaxID=1170562 RepID=UPI0002A04A3A|nr:zinc ABC transporter substrate-binding protein [Calothrix sp. PCC 6303]AFZ00654.1 periplasmic solute binding protein [Calothrix sp. PCC 6303]
MRKFFILLFVLKFLLISCNNAPKTAKNYVITTSKPLPKVNNLPQVVATTSILCDLTKQIAAKTINLICIIPHDTDSRTYKPTPENSQVIRSAKLILYHGYNLEKDLISLIKTSKTSGLKIAVGEMAVPKPLLVQQGNKKNVNPYLWHYVPNAAKMATLITNNLKKIAPENTTLYSNNNKKLQSELTQLDKWIKSRIASLPPNQRTFVSNYDNLSYYTKAYKLNYQTLLTNRNRQQELSKAELDRLIKNIQNTKVSTIFLSRKINPKLINSISNKAQVRNSERQIMPDSLTLDAEGNTYQKFMVANTRTIVEGLGGTYLIFRPIK